MTDPTTTIAYPRRRLARGMMRGLGRGLVPALTRTKITGLNRFPDSGPLIVVGNHIATMEVVLMVVYAPWQIEMLGPGDITPPPAMDAIARFHGYIPINRGNPDRQALTQALDVLRQGGILGMFPEGGIWDPGAMEAKRGVAWLSQRAHAPILPIGFGGLEGAMNAVFALKRPELVMNVGMLIPPVQTTPGPSRKHGLRAAAREIMEAVEALIPQQYRIQAPDILGERFELRIGAMSGANLGVGIPDEIKITHRDALCKFFYRPAIVRIFIKDLHLPASPLQRLDLAPSPTKLIDALDPILQYVAQDNPGFFTYRFGPIEGRAMEMGLRELRILVQWAADNALTLRLQPIRRYHLAGRSDEITEHTPAEAHTW
jgi:1-acyl-sn-glycerol-3-phosphate acyltransferase